MGWETMQQLNRSTSQGVTADPRARPAPQVVDARIAPAASASWGWLPTLSLAGAGGLLLVALANNQARAGAAWPDALFWAGLLLLFAPVAARLLAPEPARRERI